jgi:hypothetical protein
MARSVGVCENWTLVENIETGVVTITFRPMVGNSKVLFQDIVRQVDAVAERLATIQFRRWADANHINENAFQALSKTLISRSAIEKELDEAGLPSEKDVPEDEE